MEGEKEREKEGKGEKVKVGGARKKWIRRDFRRKGRRGSDVVQQ